MSKETKMSLTCRSTREHRREIFELRKQLDCAVIEVPQRQVWDRKSYLFVAAIDFGTTYTSWAFSSKATYKRCPTQVQTAKWPLGKQFSGKAPTTILIKPDGKTIGAFGSEAESMYLELAADNNHKQWYYFQHFKMSLHREGVIREMTLTDVNGRTLPAITVFGLCIRHLKDNLLECCNKQTTGITEKDTEQQAKGITAKDIYWVLTVPAIWNDASKQFMREAAIFAGINGTDLIIGLEPECASIFCCENDATYGPFLPGTKYLVVDAGGGTIDIIAHEVREDGQLREIISPTGSDWGGNRVNEAFMQFMDKHFGEGLMLELKRNQAEDYMELLQEFECKKRLTNHEAETVTIKLPFALSPKTILPNKDLVYKERDKIRMPRHIFQTFFNGCKDGMISELSKLLENEEGIDPDYILLVGGLSESTIIQTAMKSAFPNKTIINPEEAGLAVLKGAVMYGHRSSVIEQRVCKYTYGISVTHNYDVSCSHPVGRRERDDKGDIRCYDLFDIHVHAGDKVLNGQEQKESICSPVYDTQTSIRCRIYATKKKNPQLVTEDGCEMIGEFTVAVTDPGRDKEFSVSMMFGGTEIEVKCVEKQTGKETKTQVNFLG